MNNLFVPSFTDIEEAAGRIRGIVHRTPVLHSSAINEIAGLSAWFKCENFQKAGAFKYRGATNAVTSLGSDEASRGVATHSSGNHAAALALAAKIRGIRCYVAMPENAPRVKIEAVRHYGAEISFCKPTLISREETLREIVDRTGATVVHPFDNFNVIAGQGTAAMEFLEETPDLDILLVPVGGGGLLSGSSISAKAIRPGVKVYGCEPVNANDAYQSFHDGVIRPALPPNTIADGLLTSLSERTFTAIRQNTDDIYTVSEAEIVEGMRLVWQRMKIIIEPSSAVPVAVMLQKKKSFAGRKVGVIISGGNCDLSNLPFHEYQNPR